MEIKSENITIRSIQGCIKTERLQAVEKYIEEISRPQMTTHATTETTSEIKPINSVKSNLG